MRAGVSLERETRARRENGRVLVLFDIDGTLLRGAADEHRDALHAAIASVYGVADPAAAHVTPAGRTDLEIARLILLDRGVPAERIDARHDELRTACCEEYAVRAPASLREKVIPGIAELLAGLHGRDGVRLSLVTGNLEPIARLKLARAGIGRFFPRGQGGFGSDAEDRAQLPGIARARAGTGRGVFYPREDTLVIGDTPRDIACAHADGVRVIAVATGPYGVEELGDGDRVAGDVAELGEQLEGYLG
jgi:phosphoglycolate phosphatase